MNEEKPRKEKKGGMTAFTAVWIGQIFSVLGSAMTIFALMLWAWTITGEATALALLGFFHAAPLLLMLPIAGAIVDRLNKKTAMILSDLAAGLGTVVMLILYMSNVLEIWHVYLIAIFVGAFGAFQWPAYSSAITVMVDKKHYARASGMVSLVGSISGIFGPIMAAMLLVIDPITQTIEPESLQFILIFDILTFCLAIGILLFVHIPYVPPAEDLDKGMRGVLRDIPYGFRYIYRRKPLFALQMVFFTFNLVSVFGMTVFTPMILAKTGSNDDLLASVMMVLSIGAVVGGIFLAIWGGPKRKINGLLGGMMVAGIGFGIGFGVDWGSGFNTMMWMLFGFLTMLLMPTLNGSSQAIWQSKVPANKQGRVFAARGVIAQGASAFAMILVGPLADLYFEPAMDVGGSLAGQFGWIAGTGPGSGMGLMILGSSILATVVAMIGYSIKRVRHVERLIPDADPESRLKDFKKKLNQRFRKGELTKEQCRQMVEEEKARLGITPEETEDS